MEVDTLQHLDLVAAGLEAFDDAFRGQGHRSGVGHRRRSAGWLCLSTPMARAPEMIAITMSITQIISAGWGRITSGRPALPAARVASQVIRPAAPIPATPAQIDISTTIHRRENIEIPKARSEANSRILERIAPRSVWEVM